MADVYDKIEYHVVTKPLFKMGPTFSTPGALSELSPEDILCALTRHANGDWGCLGPEDWEENQRALNEGGRLFSNYDSKNGQRFWIITEADRSVTTILLPEEY